MYRGLELFFNEQDAGAFGLYRCALADDTNYYPRKEFGEPFSILVEGMNSAM